MNSLEVSFIFFILVPHSISFGRCDDISFSICWMSKDPLERHSGNIWLNDTSLKSIRKVGKVSSLTVSSGVENKLTLQYGGAVEAWIFRITPRTKFIKIRGRQKPLKQPTHATKGFLDSMSPTEVFACENNTLFFRQDENFFVAIGHTMRLPVKLESRTASMLLVSWAGRPTAGGAGDRIVTLYRTELSAFKALSTDATADDHYRFTALDACSRYVACVETAGRHSFTCLATITDPDLPRDLEVTSWNSSSVSLAWDCPEKFSSFLLTSFYLDGEDHVTEEVLSWHPGHESTYVLSDLEPCTRVKFGLQTVCQAGSEYRYSKMVFNGGNSAHSRIEALRQTSFGPDNYTLSWKVGNATSISAFRLHNEGALQGTTLATHFTVGGLLPCRPYLAKVEALCGDGVLLSTKTITAHTGPHGVSSLRYRSIDSTARWTPLTTDLPAVVFLYELSLENGSTVVSSNVTDAALRLPGLEDGKTYILDVWEECGGHWESERSQVHFQGANLSLDLLLRAAAPGLHQGDLQFDFPLKALTMVVPWSLPDELQDDESEPRKKMGNIFRDKMQELLKDFKQPALVEVPAFEPADEPDKTEIQFVTFDASETGKSVVLPVEDQLDHIRSLKAENMTVSDGVIHWEGPDLCETASCPPASLCINTLGSYACVCQRGFYDVSAVVEPPAASQPLCNEKGVFSQCLEEQVTGGIAKPYLTSYMGGKVDVRLNDGRCTADESDAFYYFRTSRKASECGTVRRVNKTHIEFQNTLTVTLTRERTITRRDLKVVLKCVYPRQYVRNAQVSVDTEWISSLSLLEFNSSLQLGVSMTLYADESYNDSYTGSVSMGLEDTLFFQVALQTAHSFASDVLLQVESCWATESPDPEDPVQGELLQDGCAVDDTFSWLSDNGRAQESRFSVQMFTMPQGLPLYFHCLTNICGHDEDCTKNCSERQRTKRSVKLTGREGRRAAVVSAGPLVVHKRASGGQPSNWAEHMTMVSVVAGSIGFLGVTVLSVSASKAIMTYYERLRLQ